MKKLIPNKNMELTQQLFATVDLLERTGNQVFSHFGLTVKTFSVLYLIQKGFNTSSEMLKIRQDSPASITQKTKTLESMGLIKRVVGKSDKRQWTFSLTPKGVKIFNHAAKGNELAADKLYEILSEKEKTVLLAVLNKTMDRLSLALKTEYLNKEFKPR